MVTKEKGKLDLVEEGSSRLEALRAERQMLSGDLYTKLDKTEQLFRDLDTADTEEVGAEMSRLEAGLNQAAGYNETIADLAEGLTDGLNTFVQFAGESRNYQGLAEKVLSNIPIFGMKKRADRMRLQRVRTQSPRENLQLILDYGEQLVTEICEVREDAKEKYGRLSVSHSLIVQKIADYEPQTASLKERLDALEDQYAEKEAVYNVASAGEQARLLVQLDPMKASLEEARHEYDQVFTKYNQAQQALEANRQSRDAFARMTRDLGRQATMLREKMENVTEIYMAAPEAVKIMMTTKGMEHTDMAMNTATDKSVDMITEAAGSVSDATLAREEMQLVDENIMRGYMDRTGKIVDDYKRRFEAIEANAGRSQEERYGGN